MTSSQPFPWPPFPPSMMTASADELTDVELQLVAGELPPDLQGHLFMVAPVGSVTSDGLPDPDGAHVWNGNGLIYRFDFDQPGRVRLTTRLAKTPCYYADLATRPGTPSQRYRFRDFGMARFSLALGMRNQLNTAFVPMAFEADGPARLLLTFDGGRPYEIDPVTLEVVTPVGSNREWRPGMKLRVPFAAVLSTAHPAFDPWTQELFTVNYGRSLANFLETIPLLYELNELPQELEELLDAIASWLNLDGLLNKLLSPWQDLAQALLRQLQGPIETVLGVADFVYLIRWDGQGPLQRWRLVDPEGKPVRIEQTMHQIGVSQDYVILMDTSLKFGLEQILSRPLPRSKVGNRALRTLLTRPQEPNTAIYLVRRDQLVPPATSEQVLDVVAQRLTIPLETGHFLVDYDNPDGRITVHIAHECATDVSEWLRRYDVSAIDHQPLPAALRGMIAVGAMDVGRLGRYIIDAEGGRLLSSQVIQDSRRTWGLGLYTYREQDVNGQPPRRFTSLYWQSLGFWPDLLPDFIYQLYQDYPHRLVPLEQLWPTPEQGQGRPSSLLRLDTETMAIADAYDFPLTDETGDWDSHVVNSPQFIPRAEAGETDTDGYLVCPVISSQAKELWIFDAAHLAQGPLCRLAHPDFQPGYTIHTTWLPTIARRQAAYHIPVRADYGPLVAQAAPAIRQLFETAVYPHFANDSEGYSVHTS